MNVELCTDCGHAADLHDRRAEDGDCSECRNSRPCGGDYEWWLALDEAIARAEDQEFGRLEEDDPAWMPLASSS